jgi:hypothetical protein
VLRQKPTDDGFVDVPMRVILRAQPLPEVDDGRDIAAILAFEPSRFEVFLVALDEWREDVARIVGA